MRDTDPLARLLGTILAAIVIFAIAAPILRRRQRLDNKAVANRVGKAGFTPLMYAATVGELGTLAELLAAGVDIDATDDLGQTALLHAVNARQLEAATLLLDAGADSNKRSNARDTPAQAARQIGGDFRALFDRKPEA